MRVITETSYRVPVFSWCPEIEEGAMTQIENLARLPFANHIAVMPDAHQGYGMPIGGVLATVKVVIPNAVGLDIGCGVHAFKTSIKNIDKKILHDIMDLTKDKVPVGFNWNNSPSRIEIGDWDKLPVVAANFDKAKYQMGSLGGGESIASVLVNCQ